jgi:hypothetical protein
MARVRDKQMGCSSLCHIFDTEFTYARYSILKGTP